MTVSINSNVTMMFVCAFCTFVSVSSVAHLCCIVGYASPPPHPPPPLHCVIGLYEGNKERATVAIELHA